jgi:hypothetical protein
MGVQECRGNGRAGSIASGNPPGVASVGGFCHDAPIEIGQERLVVAISIWQVFLVLVIAGVVTFGGGLKPGRPLTGPGTESRRSTHR